MRTPSFLKTADPSFFIKAAMYALSTVGLSMHISWYAGMVPPVPPLVTPRGSYPAKQHRASPRVGDLVAGVRSHGGPGERLFYARGGSKVCGASIRPAGGACENPIPRRSSSPRGAADPRIRAACPSIPPPLCQRGGASGPRPRFPRLPSGNAPRAPFRWSLLLLSSRHKPWIHTSALNSHAAVVPESQQLRSPAGRHGRPAVERRPRWGGRIETRLSRITRGSSRRTSSRGGSALTGGAEASSSACRCRGGPQPRLSGTSAPRCGYEPVFRPAPRPI